MTASAPQTLRQGHLDEVFLTINGEQHYLWSAADQERTIREDFVQRRRDQKAAKKFFRGSVAKLLFRELGSL